MTEPIIFGDFIKIGAAREDRMYEELSNIDKVKASLGDVRFILLLTFIWHYADIFLFFSEIFYCEYRRYAVGNT